jgi:hypothetical protein
MSEKWKGRYELPVMGRLDIRFDIERIRAELAQFASGKIWNGLGSDYADMCEAHTKLPAMFFTKEELDSVECICDLDWEKSSYRQLSLTEFDETYDINARTDMSGTAWDTRVAKHDSKADERWYRRFKPDLPPYLREVLNTFPNFHRTRFAELQGGNRVKPHIDYDTTYGVRLHIALTTNDECFNGGWDKDGNEVKFHIPDDGSVWFINPGVKHYALNGGTTPRNHIIISMDNQSILEHLV